MLDAVLFVPLRHGGLTLPSLLGGGSVHATEVGGRFSDALRGGLAALPTAVVGVSHAVTATIGNGSVQSQMSE